MSWYGTNLTSAFLLPPLSLILLGLIGIALLKRRPSAGRILAGTALTLLGLLSTPFIADSALRRLETLPTSETAGGNFQAIVVLGGGNYFNAPEYDSRPTVNHYSLERIRYAAHLHRLTGKPILVSGGAPQGNYSSEAAEMKRVLEEEFAVPVQWMEDRSANTRENAYKSLKILRESGIFEVALVTHAWHMPRAAREFAQAGFKTVPAATGFTTRHKTDVFAFIPTAGALQKSKLFLHEMIGMLWYQLAPPPQSG